MKKQVVENIYILQSVDNALAVLDLLCEKDNLGVAEIAQQMGLGKSTVFRLVSTLVHKKYLFKDNNSKYHLSFKFASISSIVSNRSVLINQIHPYLSELSSLTNETTHLVIWHSDHKIIFVDKVIGSHSISMKSMLGFTQLAHMTATGKALLAYANNSFLENYLSTIPFLQLTDTSIVNRKSLEEILKQIKIDEVAYDNEESENGLTCFAAPILQMNQIIAAISISGPTDRMNKNKNTLTELLKGIAQNIMTNL